MKGLPQRLIWVFVGLGIATLAVLALRPTPIRVDVRRVDRGNLQVTVDAEGKTRVRDRFVISAPVAGRLARIELKEGNSVQQGMVVARIDPLPYEASVRDMQAQIQEWKAQRAGVETQRPKQEALAQARARIATAQATQRQVQAKVAQAQAALEQARRDRDRAEELQASGAISRERREAAELAETTRTQELEAAKLEAQGAASDVKAAQAALSVLQAERSDPDYLLGVYNAKIASAEAQLAKLRDDAVQTEVRSPVGGDVLRVLQESTRVVAAGTPLLEVGKPADLELVIDVLSTDAVKVKPGARILVDRWGGDRILQAKVRQVEPSAFTKVSALGVEEQRVNIIADFVEASGSLGDGYRVEARIVVWDGKNVLKVPLGALFRCNENWCAFVVKEGKAQRRQVEVGHRSDFEAEVRRGLVEGEGVMLYPTEQLKDGGRVEVK
ncbi:MAG TPA: HlyD family efflux transporter periplasmic adaptor subunit [Allocoleopsis sp.]